MVMSSVRIAELKSHLSEHLRTVRRGRSITVLDRDTPIARLVPYAPEAGTLTVRLPKPGSPPPGRVRLPPPLKISRDVVELLLEERQRER
jgi:prevent-host-death family protein